MDPGSCSTIRRHALFAVLGICQLCAEGGLLGDPAFDADGGALKKTIENTKQTMEKAMKIVSDNNEGVKASLQQVEQHSGSYKTNLEATHAALAQTTSQLKAFSGAFVEESNKWNEYRMGPMEKALEGIERPIEMSKEAEAVLAHIAKIVADPSEDDEATLKAVKDEIKPKIKENAGVNFQLFDDMVRKPPDDLKDFPALQPENTEREKYILEAFQWLDENDDKVLTKDEIMKAQREATGNPTAADIAELNGGGSTLQEGGHSALTLADYNSHQADEIAPQSAKERSPAEATAAAAAIAKSPPKPESALDRSSRDRVSGQISRDDAMDRADATSDQTRGLRQAGGQDAMELRGELKEMRRELHALQDRQREPNNDAKHVEEAGNGEDAGEPVEDDVQEQTTRKSKEIPRHTRSRSHPRSSKDRVRSAIQRHYGIHSHSKKHPASVAKRHHASHTAAKAHGNHHRNRPIAVPQPHTTDASSESTLESTAEVVGRMPQLQSSGTPQAAILEADLREAKLDQKFFRTDVQKKEAEIGKIEAEKKELEAERRVAQLERKISEESKKERSRDDAVSSASNGFLEIDQNGSESVEDSEQTQNDVEPDEVRTGRSQPTDYEEPPEESLLATGAKLLQASRRSVDWDTAPMEAVERSSYTTPRRRPSKDDTFLQQQ